MERIRNKIARWHNSILSQGGKLVLLKHVLCSLSMYTFATWNLPKMVTRQMERDFSSFFWGHYEGHGKRVWASWPTIARQYKEGVLGIRRLHEVVGAFSIKLWWKLRL
ncbi:uncharacterized protein M6B38_297515 [Iris pallida]|uniref:Reverse transcriptase n=1 Tax=Iris pallida TaxID=29817 RepID=A0AAX6HRA7_IRIPA|nr:uncharacterized protein M6B38_297515 [Iris pallida]